MERTALNDLQQRTVIDREIALRNSHWTIRESRKLLDTVEKLLRE
jgi:hypothetical protein